MGSEVTDGERRRPFHGKKFLLGVCSCTGTVGGGGGSGGNGGGGGGGGSGVEGAAAAVVCLDDCVG